MKIKELYTDKSRWTQWTMARNKAGYSCSISAFESESFCLLGAIQKCYGSFCNFTQNSNPAEQAVAKIKDHLRITDIVSWNDSENRSFEEVKALVDELDI